MRATEEKKTAFIRASKWPIEDAEKYLHFLLSLENRLLAFVRHEDFEKSDTCRAESYK